MVMQVKADMDEEKRPEVFFCLKRCDLRAAPKSGARKTDEFVDLFLAEEVSCFAPNREAAAV